MVTDTWLCEASFLDITSSDAVTVPHLTRTSAVQQTFFLEEE